MADVIIPVNQSIAGNPPDDALVVFVVGPEAVGTRRWDAILAQLVALATELPEIPEDGRNYTLRGRDNIGEGGENEPITFWAMPFEVPSTPGEASGIGHVLTVFGEGDRDYRWAASASGLPAIPEDGFDYTLKGRDRIGVGGANDPIRFWARAREVPSTPGTQSGIGRILTVYGTNDTDYRWETLDVTAAVDAAVDEYLEANPPTAGVDAEARRLANAAGTAAMAANAAAAAAQLDTDTVIKVGPPFVHDEDGPRNLGVSIRHPIGAYSEANVMAVSVAGQPAVLVGYDPTLIHQDGLAGVSAVALTNIWNVQDTIPDGQGGTRRVQRYTPGSYIPVTVTLRGPGQSAGETIAHFSRIIEVLVVDPDETGGDVDQTARDAAAAARTIANANAASLIPPSDTEAETATATNVRGWSAAKLRRLVEAIVPAWARASGPSIAAATIGSAIGFGTRTLKDNTALALARNARTTIIARNNANLPAGASYANATGILTLGVGVWQVNANAVLRPGSAVSDSVEAGLVLMGDVEGPTAAVDLASNLNYIPRDFSRSPADLSPTVSALVTVVDLGGGNDSITIKLGAEFNTDASLATMTVQAARIDLIKLS